MNYLNLSFFYYDYSCFEKRNEIYQNNSEEESSTNTSDSLEENELNRFLPSNILKIIKNELIDIVEKDNKDGNENNKEKIKNKPDNTLTSFINQLNLNSKPFIPKSKLNNNYSSNIKNNEREESKLNNNNKFLKDNHSCYHMNNNNSNNNKNRRKKNQKKKGYIEKEGDWPCYDCKNINFSFRDACNRCKLPKEESEKKYKEAGERLLKLFNINKNNDTKNNENSFFNLKKELLIR